MTHKISILGAGMFGTAIANIVAENGRDVWLWARDEEQAKSIETSRENVKYLPGYPVHEKVHATSDLKQSVKDAKVIFVSVPSSSVREVIKSAKPYLNKNAFLVSTTKGVEPDGFRLMSQVLREEIETMPVGVLSGPNLAEEIAQKQITATVIASESHALIKQVQEILHASYFRVYSSDDVYGIELAGALKNIYAISAGFAAALGVGHNTLGVLLTRSLAEMSRFAHAMGAKPLTFLGLAGVGDLMVTCMSPLSRNYQLGFLIGQGLSLQEAETKLGKLAEGVNTVRIVRQKAEEMNVYMPLANGLYDIMFNSRSVEEVIHAMMMADQPSDVEFVT